jgi:hypothetical protein
MSASSSGSGDGSSYDERQALSIKQFRNVVAPLLLAERFGCRMINVEQQVTKTEEVLDKQCGIDYLLDTRVSVVAVSSRIQTIKADRTPFRTFTIRCGRNGFASELEKLKLAHLDPQILRSGLTLQAYLDPNQTILVMGVIRTRDLAEYVTSYEEIIDRRTNSQDGKQFLSIPWAQLEDAGYTVDYYSSISPTL